MSRCRPEITMNKSGWEEGSAARGNCSVFINNQVDSNTSAHFTMWHESDMFRLILQLKIVNSCKKSVWLLSLGNTVGLHFRSDKVIRKGICWSGYIKNIDCWMIWNAHSRKPCEGHHQRLTRLLQSCAPELCEILFVTRIFIFHAFPIWMSNVPGKLSIVLRFHPQQCPPPPSFLGGSERCLYRLHLAAFTVPALSFHTWFSMYCVVLFFIAFVFNTSSPLLCGKHLLKLLPFFKAS